MTGRRRGALSAIAHATVVTLTLAAGLERNVGAQPARETRPPRPNIIYILADDLGWGEVGCYGQKKIRTPHVDRLAAEGIRFTQHYSGSPVCAPSRCTLLTGLHTGHAFVRDNYEMGGWKRGDPEGQLPLPPGTHTLGTMLEARGYRTAAIGKWGLGGPGSTGHPNRQGFDLFFGYLCQRIAHNYYPAHLWRNDEKVPLRNDWFKAHQRLKKAPDDASAYARYAGRDYAPDLMIAEALKFIRSCREGAGKDGAPKPFFLWFASPIPHAALQVPSDTLARYEGSFPETPYLGDRGYLPHPTPRAAYAAMVTRLDAQIGRIMHLLKELDIDRETIVMFSSDNGPTFNGGTDSEFFESAGPFRGRKCSVYEGGIRVPFIVRWPGKIRAGRVSDHVSAFWDVLPTVAGITGPAITRPGITEAEAPPDLDGVSFLPTLLDDGTEQPRHDHLYWEYHARGGMQAVRWGDWKAVWLQRSRRDEIALYDLAEDPAESRDVAAEHPQLVARARALMDARTPSPIPRWNFRRKNRAGRDRR